MVIKKIDGLKYKINKTIAFLPIHDVSERAKFLKKILPQETKPALLNYFY